MKVPLLKPVSIRSFDSRYTVYLSEIQKRFTYTGISFLLAFFLAYTQRVSLMYSMTLSLQRALPGGANVNTARKEVMQSEALQNTFLSFFESIKEVDRAFLSKCYQKVVDAVQNVTQNPLHAQEETIETLFASGEERLSSPPLLAFSEDAAISGDCAVRFIFTDVEEAFYTLLSVSLFWCLFVCFPVLLYHTLCFFQPGFYAWQSRRVWFSVLRRVILVYGVLQLMHLFIIPGLLSFFYSFQIERASLYLHAETKIVSYVSMYVFVYCIAVAFLVVTGIWSSYKQRRILRCLHATRLPLEKGLVKDKYRDYRGKVWWGCLLGASLASPPEISIQLGCTSLLILLSEISIWVAYVLSCRSWNKIHLSHLSL